MSSVLGFQGGRFLIASPVSIFVIMAEAEVAVEIFSGGRGLVGRFRNGLYRVSSVLGFHGFRFFVTSPVSIFVNMAETDVAVEILSEGRGLVGRGARASGELLSFGIVLRAWFRIFMFINPKSPVLMMEVPGRTVLLPTSNLLFSAAASLPFSATGTLPSREFSVWAVAKRPPNCLVAGGLRTDDEAVERFDLDVDSRLGSFFTRI